MDVLLTVLFSPFLFTTTLVLAMYVKTVSSGPVLFRQVRIGRNGVPFTCLKIRTMIDGACSSGHREHLARLAASNQPLTKLDQLGDQRLIPGAALIRAAGLDELPQVLNVLKGEMSFVGPRPCLPYEYALYSDEQKSRQEVLPGITGYWQVNGKNSTTFSEMIEMDLYYARNISFGLDLKILCKTAGAVFQQIVDWIRR